MSGKPETNFDTLPDSAHITIKEVAMLLGVSVMTVYRQTKDGSLPQPKKFSKRCTRYELGAVRRAAKIGNYHEAEK